MRVRKIFSHQSLEFQYEHLLSKPFLPDPFPHLCLYLRKMNRSPEQTGNWQNHKCFFPLQLCFVCDLYMIMMCIIQFTLYIKYQFGLVVCLWYQMWIPMFMKHEENSRLMFIKMVMSRFSLKIWLHMSESSIQCWFGFNVRILFVWIFSFMTFVYIRFSSFCSHHAFPKLAHKVSSSSQFPEKRCERSVQHAAMQQGITSVKSLTKYSILRFILILL